MCAKRLRINGRKVDLALVGLGERLQILGKLCTLLRGFGKDIGEGDTSL